MNDIGIGIGIPMNVRILSSGGGQDEGFILLEDGGKIDLEAGGSLKKESL